MKRFNTTGKCNPQMHYMVNIDRQVEAAAKLVRQGDYFCINRGRQYGKTTTLAALKTKLEKEGYGVLSISFEGLSDENMKSLELLNYSFIRRVSSYLRWETDDDALADVSSLLSNYPNRENARLSSDDFADLISEICSGRNIVLIIDEVDQASNNIAFIQFLGILRDLFLKRDRRPTFQSVILAGVYDVKNLKLKVRPKDNHQYNSPWNIAVPYNEDMSLPEDGIAGMLEEYKADHNLSFDHRSIAKMIYAYTAGYPFLVSYMCNIMDANQYPWNSDGVLKSVNTLLNERNVLFDDIAKKIEDNPELKQTLMGILYSGTKYAFSPYEKYLQLGLMFNFITNDNGIVSISCRMIETMLYTLFITEEKQSVIFGKGQSDKNQFIHDGIIDMRHLLERFCIHFNDIFRTANGTMDQEFIEKQGRKQFLLYLRPIINGIGNYYVEAETRDETRTDIVIDYMGQQYIIELKIWHGNSYNERGEQQLKEYLEFYHQKKGYMISFCFNKGKKPGVKTVNIDDYELVEAIV